MTNLVSCSRCQRNMMNEEYDSHRCMPKIKKFKTSTYAHSYFSTDSRGRKMLVVYLIDGTVCEFVHIPEEKEHTKIPYQPTENTRHYTDEDSTHGLHRTFYYHKVRDQYSSREKNFIFSIH